MSNQFQWPERNKSTQAQHFLYQGLIEWELKQDMKTELVGYGGNPGSVS